MPNIGEWLNKKKLPQTGNIVIHLDSHPDVLIPDENNWILIEACEGFFSTIVWIKPPWADSLRDGSYSLVIGRDDSGSIGICSNLPLFVSTCSYKSLEKLINPKEILLEVITFGKFILKKRETDDFTSLLERIRGRFPENGRYYLSIDMDFFSTYNPYEKLYEKVNLYEQLIELYCFGVNENLNTNELEESVKTRSEQMKELENLWRFAGENGVEGKAPPNSELWRELKNIARKLLASYSEIDWELVHKAGLTWDYKGDPLIEHLTSRPDILRLIDNTFSGLLVALPNRPAAITIPMLDNNYCPEEDEQFIYQQLIVAIEAKFGIKIKEHYFS